MQAYTEQQTAKQRKAVESTAQEPNMEQLAQEMGLVSKPRRR